ncbi:MAG TPA: UDP-2,3-diacylglucosamine diphosphatase LpxI [Myxococcales bacterium]
MSALGLIAGNGTFPLLFARGARKAGHRVVAAALKGEADPALAPEVDELFWVGVGQLGKLIETLKRHGVREAAFAGGVGKLSAFRHARPDLTMLRALTRLKHFNDDALLRSIAQAFEDEGIRIVPSTRFLADALAVPGAMTRRKPTAEEEKDVALGLEVAEAIGRADVGQTVAVKGGNVIAVEAAEGTDACIRRAGGLAGKGLVVVKRSKPRQDERFDLPAVGPGTIETLAEVHGAVLAIEAGKTIVLEPEELVKRADQARIAVVAK